MKTTKIVRAFFLSDEAARAFVAAPVVCKLPHDEPLEGSCGIIRVAGVDRRGLRHAVREAAFACHAIRVDTLIIK